MRPVPRGARAATSPCGRLRSGRSAGRVGSLLAVVLGGALGPAATPAAGQWLPARLQEHLGIPRPTVQVDSRVGVRSCCGVLGHLRTRMEWERSAGAARLGLAVLGALHHDGADPYRSSGLEGSLGWSDGVRHARLALEGTVGSGYGPGGAFGLAGGAGRRGLEVRFRSVRVLDVETDREALPGGASTRVDGGYTDVEVLGDRSLGRVELGLRVGARAGETGFRGADEAGPGAWLSGSLALAVTDHVAVEVAGGERPERLEVGQPGGRFAELALRVSVRGPAARPRPVPPGPPPVPLPGPRVRRLGAERYVVRLRLPGATSVEIRGDATDWEARPMRRTPGTRDAWEAVLLRAPGVYHVQIRVDAADWSVPAGLVPVPDRFGGLAGLLDLPDGEEGNDGKR